VLAPPGRSRAVQRVPPGGCSGRADNHHPRQATAGVHTATQSGARSPADLRGWVVSVRASVHDADLVDLHVSGLWMGASPGLIGSSVIPRSCRCGRHGHAIIGEQAERLVYFYASCDRRFSYPHLAQPAGPFKDRFTGIVLRPRHRCGGTSRSSPWPTNWTSQQSTQIFAPGPHRRCSACLPPGGTCLAKPPGSQYTPPCRDRKGQRLRTESQSLTGEGWPQLFAEAARFPGLSSQPVMVPCARRAAVLAAVAAATMPVLLAADHLFGPTAFDVLAWPGRAWR
jgi:hypothetical protein